MHFWPYLLAGMFFGFAVMKGEITSWYRIQEMFHFQSFHMFGIIMTAVLTGFLSLRLMKPWMGRPSLEGTPMTMPSKKPGRINYLAGGFIFGLGWGIIGLCPGPIFSLVGAGSLGAVAILAGALHGAWLYGALSKTLPK